MMQIRSITCLLCAGLLLLSFEGATSARAQTQGAQRHDPLLVLLSPSISQQDKADFYNSLVHLCMEGLVPGDRVVIYDGSNLHLLANFTVPANAKSPKVKVKAFTPLWNGVANFLKPSNDRKTVQAPQFLNQVMQVFPGTKPRILIVGSSIYTDSAHKYDMSEGWLSDGFLNASGSESIFSILGKERQLNGTKVYYCYLTDEVYDPTNDKDAHKAKIQSFWSKYVAGMGGTLVAFLPNLKEVFTLWRDGSVGEVPHEPINGSDKSMSIIKPAPPHTETIWDKKTTVSLPSDLLFSSGSADLKDSATTSLRELAMNMKADKNLRFCIYGYTDSHGSASANQTLSLRRAEAVKTWLVQKGNVDPSSVETQGCGKTKLIVPPGSSTSEAPNRRVEISVIK